MSSESFWPGEQLGLSREIAGGQTPVRLAENTQHLVSGVIYNNLYMPIDLTP
jgi:hypothetical protein